MLQFSAADSVPSCRKSSGQTDGRTDGRTDTHTTRLPYAVAPPLGIIIKEMMLIPQVDTAMYTTKSIRARFRSDSVSLLIYALYRT